MTDPRQLPEVWQAEWCPHSHVVRAAFTELGVDFVARQVPAERDERDEMEREVGSRAIPVVRLADGTVLSGDDDEIVAALKQRFSEPPTADDHRAKAREKGSATADESV